MKKVILVTGSSSGIGKLACQLLAMSGNRVYASMRDIEYKNKSNAKQLMDFALEQNLDLRIIELDILSEESIKSGISLIEKENSSIDVVVHNAGHMSYGPSEAFSAKELISSFDTNVVGAHRVNRVVLPLMRKNQQGLVLWISSSSCRGGTPPLLGPYFAAKAAMDSLAVSYATELTKWGIETTIIVPGAFINGTNHFQNASLPHDIETQGEYLEGPLKGIDKKIQTGFELRTPVNTNPITIAEKIVEVVSTEHGKRPFRVHIDPCDDGCEVVNNIADRVRKEFLREMGLGELLQVLKEKNL